MASHEVFHALLCLDEFFVSALLFLFFFGGSDMAATQNKILFAIANAKKWIKYMCQTFFSFAARIGKLISA